MYAAQLGSPYAVRGAFRGLNWPLCQHAPESFADNICRLDDTVVGGQLRSVAVCRFGTDSAAQIAFDLGDWA